jgi:hypothetical protein
MRIHSEFLIAGKYNSKSMLSQDMIQEQETISENRKENQQAGLYDGRSTVPTEAHPHTAANFQNDYITYAHQIQLVLARNLTSTLI